MIQRSSAPNVGGHAAASDMVGTRRCCFFETPDGILCSSVTFVRHAIPTAGQVRGRTSSHYRGVYSSTLLVGTAHLQAIRARYLSTACPIYHTHARSKMRLLAASLDFFVWPGQKDLSESVGNSHRPTRTGNNTLPRRSGDSSTATTVRWFSGKEKNMYPWLTTCQNQYLIRYFT